MNAGRLGIALLDTDGSSLLKPGTSHNKGQGEKVTETVLSFLSARMFVATPEALRTKSVVPGDYEATATFELTYR
ncbi:fimbrial protein (plasmid) [Escherichia coli]|nr:fimbrial protein [Escherichia coli]